MSNIGSDRPLRLLAPAPSTPISGGGGGGGGGGGSAATPGGNGSISPKNLLPRRKLIKNACRSCQAKKTKCDGKRPSCSRCGTRGLGCAYDTLYEGMTKHQSSEYEINRLRQALSELEQKFQVLKYGSLDEAQAMLDSMRRDMHDGTNQDPSQSQETLDLELNAMASPEDNFSPGPVQYDFELLMGELAPIEY